MASAWSQLDQLLTCAICLDRYRNPKLLPCQHTFCMEPCLDGLIDYARRQIKCPECRAEHRIPYQGIQQFPTNVTLMRFLELHRDITGEEPEPPPSMMERCSVCSEKSNVEKCAHCDKKICPDCKEAHVDILRREINRINNQVRRGLHRLSEALTQTKKNAEKLQFNCTQVKDEIEDIVRRYSKDLKVTEDKLKHDLEIYTQTEMKSINKLKEDLEIEVNNITSNCELVDKYVTDDFEWSDIELLEYKQIFIKMLDFLRTFDPDNADFTRRIKFQPRADPDVLHRNIADFGELKINAPMNSVPTQQSLMPPSNALMRSQSDHRLAAQFARRCDNRSFSDINQRMDSERDSGRPSSPLMGRRREDGYRRYSERSRDYDYQDRVSSRYNRDDTALSSRWRDNDDYVHRNRYPRDYDECDTEPHQGRTVRFADEQAPRERVFDVDEASKGPLSGVFKLLDSPKVMERLHQNETKQKQHQAEKEKEKEKVNQPQTPPVIPPQPTTQPKRQPTRQQSEDDIDRQKKANQQAGSSASSNPPSDTSNNVLPPKVNSDSTRTTTMPESSRTTESAEIPEDSRNRGRLTGTSSLDEPTSEAPRNTSRFARSTLVKTASLDSGETSRKPLDKKIPPRAATPARQEESESDEDDDDNENYETAKEPPKPVMSSFFARQRRLPDPEPRLLEMHESDSEEESESEEESDEDEDEEEEEEEEAVGKQVTPAAATKPSTSAAEKKSQQEDEDDEEEDEEESESSTSSSGSESESAESSDQVFQNTPNVNSKKQSSSDSNDTANSKKDMNNHYSEDSDDQDESSQKDDELRSKNSESTTKLKQPLENRTRKSSDDTDTTDSSSASSSNNYSNRNAAFVSSNGTEDRMSSEGSGNDSGTGRFRNRPYLARSKSSHEIGLGFDDNLDLDDEEEEPTTPTYNTRPTRKSEDITRTRPSSVDTTNSSNSCWANYLKNKYGSNATGRVVPRSRSSHSLYQRSDEETSDDEVPSGRDPILSSTYSFSSPRSTYMQKRRMMLKLGTRGTDPGNFTWPRGVAVGTENSMIVADSSNHRIQVFDSIGKFLFEFGSYGSSEGEFDCPAGVSVNRIGQFIVSDRYNHRVQLFDPTGRFLRAFGCEGRTDGRFNYPWGIATDSLGFIYVCDKENHRIQVFQSDGTFVGKFGAQGCRPGQLEHPHYVAVTNTNRVVVTDTNNHRVQVFDVNGRSLSSFGSEGSSDGQFKFPRGVAVDDQGYIIVGDSGNNRIQVFQPDGTFLRSFGTWGAGDGEFKGLEGLAVTSGGSIIACDRENHRIQVF